jgi:nucleotide-binding universal stress UspA family protein
MTSSPKKILVATDFSEGSDEALAEAIELATRTGAALEIVYVLEIGVDPFPIGLTYYDDRGPLIAFLDRALSERADRAAKAGIACATKILEGRARTEIVKRAGDIGAEVIVVGTHGRTGFAHAVLGSVAERVVRHARCSVLTVPFSRKAA